MSSRAHGRHRSNGSVTLQPASDESPTTTQDRARTAATQICEGFVAHDRRDGAACLEAFQAVDRLQFPHLSREAADAAGFAFAASLWAKDEVERPYVDGDTVVDLAGLAAADWRPVREWLEERAAVVGMDPEYARLTTEAWKRHKVGGDYWTPTMAAQQRELAAALDRPSHPDKPRFGTDGFGHLATRYLTAVELHDMRTPDHWSEAVDVMTTYFDTLFERQELAR